MSNNSNNNDSSTQPTAKAGQHKPKDNMEKEIPSTPQGAFDKAKRITVEGAEHLKGIGTTAKEHFSSAAGKVNETFKEQQDNPRTIAAKVATDAVVATGAVVAGTLICTGVTAAAIGYGAIVGGLKTINATVKAKDGIGAWKKLGAKNTEGK